MTFTVFGKKRIEKLYLFSVLGALEALKNKRTSINESECFVFTPYTFSKLKKKGFDKRIVNLIAEGCELEDIESLCPEKLDKVIEELRQRTLDLLETYEEDNKEIWVSINAERINL